VPKPEALRLARAWLELNEVLRELDMAREPSASYTAKRGKDWDSHEVIDLSHQENSAKVGIDIPSQRSANLS
jgi:hypothetical protein